MQQVSSSSSKGRLATKEKEAAVQQITAEQLLREAAALQSDEVRTGTGRRMVDEDELNEYRVRKRKQFEDSLRRRRTAMNIWTSYALWEAAQNDFRRARSVFERALEVDEKNVEIWKKYLDMEEQNGFVNSARNLYDRITCQLPRFDHFWLRYVKFEELLSNYGGCRLIYERWMEHQPDDRAWILYAQFEERCNEIERARAVMESYLVVHPKITSFLKFAQWEEQHRMYDRARSAFLKAMEILPEEHLNENFFLKFAKFEERCKNFHLVEQLCLHGIAKNQQPSSSPLLTSYYIGFQKRNGNSQQIENIVLDQRRKDYHLLLQQTSEYDYDIWLNLIRLEESTGDYQNILKIYEQFITKVPPVQTKRSWKRYFYIFLNYAIYEELTNNNEENARNILHKLLSLVPHHIFSFTKLWIYLAQFELRMRKLDQARLVFGQAIAKYPNPKIFKTYSNIELKLGNLQRARTILAKYIEIHPSSAQSWLAFIDLELVLQEYSRARSLFELAIQNQNHIENAEVVRKIHVFKTSACRFGKLILTSKPISKNSIEPETCSNASLTKPLIGEPISH